MPQAGRFDRRYIMNKIKMYSTSLTTIEADIFKQIKILAEKLNRDKNNLLEEAAQDLIKKYKHHELRTSNGWATCKGDTFGDFTFIGIMILGLVFFVLLI